MKRWGILFCLMLAVFLELPLRVQAEPNVYAQAAVLMDGYTGKILWEKNAHKMRYPASTVKMLTTMLALEMADRKETVIIGPDAEKTCVGQTIGLVQGDMLTVEDLVRASLLWSANDAAVALGEYLAVSPELFALMMNKKAWALGAFDSRFTNANGYSEPGQFTTAYDLALIGRAAMQNAFIAETVRRGSARINWINKKKSYTVVNTNQLLDSYPGANGIKTGTTSAAGGCLVGSAVRGSRWLVTVVLGSKGRYSDTVRMMEYGFGLKSPAVKTERDAGPDTKN